jgi:hypothetical protein
MLKPKVSIITNITICLNFNMIYAHFNPKKLRKKNWAEKMFTPLPVIINDKLGFPSESLAGIAQYIQWLGNGLDDLGIGVQLFFLLSTAFRPPLGAQPVSLLMGAWYSFTGEKTGGAWI